MRAPRTRRRPAKAAAELVVTVAVALFFALTIQAYAVKPYRIPSGSMEPTLDIGQRILVDRAAHRLGARPHVGDVVVFHPPAGADRSEDQCGDAGAGPSSTGPGSARSCDAATPAASAQTFVKRVVGEPGDRIAIRDGHVIRNGRRASEPFTAPCAGSSCTLHAVTVPAGHYFLMGDNRGDSDDSRFWGPVPLGQVIGGAFGSYWPPGRAGRIG